MLAYRNHAVLLAFVLGISPATADPPRVGYPVEAFSLKTSDGKTFSPAEFKNAKATVVVFLGTECPINNAYLPRLAELHKKYAGQGVQFFGINSNRHDTAENVANHAKKNAMPFSVLKDDGHTAADRFKAERTPEAFVVDATGKVVYRGRIDDQIGYRYRRPAASKNELADAVDDVLAGKAVRVAVTDVEGCFISRAVATKKEGTLTYSRDIAPIFHKNCQECHRPGNIGPMQLLTYDNVVDWSATIREVVSDGRMPPWHADPKHGSFLNDRSLPKADRDKLLAWIDSGMARGEDRETPPKPASDGWRIGKPDKVLTMPVEYRVPPKAEKGVLRYQYFMIPTDFDEDVWIQAIEAKPGNTKVVHHILVYVRNPGEAQRREDGIGNGLLTAFAPGDLPSIFPEGTAKKVKKGAIIALQMHYTPVATAETDRSSVGLIFSKTPPKYEAHTRAIANNRLSIPPQSANHRVTSATTLREDTLLISLFPHMHLRGKSFEYRVVYPDGKEQMLLNVPAYDFNWQTNYLLKEPLKLPAGTRIECTAHFDNSPGNKNNPDPDRTVRWGEQTWEEMMIGFIDYVRAPKE